MTKIGLGPHYNSSALVSRTREAWSQVEASPSNSQLTTPGLGSHDCMVLQDNYSTAQHKSNIYIIHQAKKFHDTIISEFNMYLMCKKSEKVYSTRVHTFSKCVLCYFTYLNDMNIHSTICCCKTYHHIDTILHS